MDITKLCQDPPEVVWWAYLDRPVRVQRLDADRVWIAHPVTGAFLPISWDEVAGYTHRMTVPKMNYFSHLPPPDAPPRFKF